MQFIQLFIELANLLLLKALFGSIQGLKSFIQHLLHFIQGNHLLRFIWLLVKLAKKFSHCFTIVITLQIDYIGEPLKMVLFQKLNTSESAIISSKRGARDSDFV